MKFGVNTMVWTTQVGEQQEPLFARIKEWGFDGVELFLSPDEPANIPAVRAIARSTATGTHHVLGAAARRQPDQLRMPPTARTEWSS